MSKIVLTRFLGKSVLPQALKPARPNGTGWTLPRRGKHTRTGGLKILSVDKVAITTMDGEFLMKQFKPKSNFL
jgi:hypothetical protein